jgi:glutamyl-tRNA reductase
MQYLVVSFSYHNSTIQIRESLACNDDKSHLFLLSALHKKNSVEEVIITSTCNRVEVLVATKDTVQSTKHIFSTLASYADIALNELEGRADVFVDQQSIAHLFAVIASLDSLVIGETQIVGQIKDSFLFSTKNNYCGKFLSRVMHYGFKCAADIRTKTDISKKPISIASVAIAKAKEQLGDLNGVKALVIGIGEMSVIAAKHLIAQGCDVDLINRTYEKAVSQMKEQCPEVNVLKWNTLKEVLNDYQLLFTSTGAGNAIITSDMVQSKNEPRYWFDVAVPRDIEIQTSEKINLFVVDDLQNIIAKNKGQREREAKDSEKIITQFSHSFYDWVDTLMVEPIIKKIYLKADYSAKIESKRAINNSYIPKEYANEAQKLAEQTIKHFLHDFTKKIKNLNEHESSVTMLNTLQYLLDDKNNKQHLDQYKHQYNSGEEQK